MTQPAILHSSYVLAHAPDFVRYGSKPWREIRKERGVEAQIAKALRPFAAAASYPPNETFLGRLSPEELGRVERPWYSAQTRARPERAAPFGVIADQPALYALLKRADVLEPALETGLVTLRAALNEGMSDRDRSRIRNLTGRVKSKRRTWRKLQQSRFAGRIISPSDISAEIHDLVGLDVEDAWRFLADPR